jgi:hypothetical protein
LRLLLAVRFVLELFILGFSFLDVVLVERFVFGRFVSCAFDLGVFVLGSWIVSVVLGRCAASDCIISFARFFFKGVTFLGWI